MHCHSYGGQSNMMKKKENESKKSIKTKNKKKEQPVSIPTYSTNGRVITVGKEGRKRSIKKIIIIVAIIVSFIYIPQFFIKDADNTYNEQVNINTAAISDINAVLRDNPSADFDKDGLENADEQTSRTNPRKIDTDVDGMVDFYEIHVSDTNPTKAEDNIIDEQKKIDNQDGDNLSTPYKIGNVILWADDYYSKAFGSVVATPTGYTFCNFDGYAQFPAEDGKYAYKNENGTRSLLSYREKENVWKVSAGDKVEIYDEKLTKIVEIDFFFNPIYIDHNAATNIIATILPDKGLIAATVKMDIDVEPDTNKNTLITIAMPQYDITNTARFTVNSNSLSDLLFVRNAISERDTCIAVSLYGAEKGEYIGIVYGFTFEGDLIIADPESMETVGFLDIEEKSRKIIDETGTMTIYEYFTFRGFGFDSKEGDNISFFAASSEAVSDEEFGLYVKEEQSIIIEPSQPIDDTFLNDDSLIDDSNTIQTTIPDTTTPTDVIEGEQIGAVPNNSVETEGEIVTGGDGILSDEILFDGELNYN